VNDFIAEPYVRPKMDGREVPFNPITGEGIAFPTGGKQLPEYDIEDLVNELPPAPEKPTHPEPPKFTGFSGTPVQRNDWDDRFWRQFEKATNYNPVTKWAFNTEQLPESAQTDSVLENIAELFPNTYTAIGLGYDDVISASPVKSVAEVGAIAAPLISKRFPARFGDSKNIQGADFIDDIYSDQSSFFPWDQYKQDVKDYNKKFTK
jgi:hypothetical protein